MTNLIQIDDPRFAVVKSVDILVPTTFQPNFELFTFRQKYSEEFRYIHESFDSGTFPEPSHTLVPGNMYTADFVSILSPVNSSICMDYQQQRGALYVGAPGAALLYEKAKHELIKGKWATFFDDPKNLYKLSEQRLLPSLYAHSKGKYIFNLTNLQEMFGRKSYLICFRAA